MLEMGNVNRELRGGKVMWISWRQGYVEARLCGCQWRFV